MTRYGREAAAPQEISAARRLAQRLNERRAARAPDHQVSAGELHGAALTDEINRLVMKRYAEQRNPRAVREALDILEARLGRPAVDATLAAFVERFPEETGDEADPGASERERALSALLRVWVANANPAFEPFRDLFDDAPLAAETPYRRLVTALQAAFAAQPPFGPEGRDLVGMLRSPSLAVPDSVAGQLRYIRERWGYLLGDLLDRLLIGLDVLEQEELDLWRRFHPAGPGGAGASVLDFRGLDADVERFSADRDWMPRVVMLAKSTYVWLDQLARAYGREVRRLDQVPDEELDRLARAGFTGLWLIGLWERSRASQRIKQLRGNADAVASAYSLHDYRIADDLGGDAALDDLRRRAWQRGIRLASDMVPNHMGIDSRWMIEHPERFLALDAPPYPSYTFGGPDLSSDERVGIFIEDHYWEGTDAAVVFRRVDRWSGDERFVYHGNDGTSIPWNDTAQLDYLRADVREAVIQTILEVARRFPIIRFDAAMTLARRHVQRLWYPEPGGGGGAIPSRAEHGMARAEFDAAMPDEFWREVVDRVAVEVPDTLLLAEAFWLMEGYFVRSLGMHRVYNSAFMNMLRDERNAEYRQVIRNTLEFDPEILKRYVSFMNNPDERTAVDQFGKGDKYFGICTLLATLPGLPMFGHGQIEGYTEKYGMEFSRAQWDEPTDQALVERHEREIFPLLHRRHLFAGVESFALYDFEADGGGVNEDVFAYSNGVGSERALVVYHNRYATASGRIRRSVGRAARDDGARRIVQSSLADGLALGGVGPAWVAFRDERSGLEYVRAAAELADGGLHLTLEAYRCHVFVDWRPMAEPADLLARLAARLEGGGVPSVHAALRELELEPARAAFAALVADDLVEGCLTSDRRARPGELAAEAQRRAAVLATALAEVVRDGPLTPADELAADERIGVVSAVRAVEGLRAMQRPTEERALWVGLLGWLAARGLGGGPGTPERGRWCLRRFDELGLGRPLHEAYVRAGLDAGGAWQRVDGVRAVLELPPWPSTPDAHDVVVRAWLASDAARRALGVNAHEGVEWFSAEAFEALVDLTTAVHAARLVEGGLPGRRSGLAGRRAANLAADTAAALRARGAASGFRVDRLSGTSEPSTDARDTR